MVSQRLLTVLGSTGSVGCNTLLVAAADADVDVFALSANSNVELLAKQCAQHNPKYAVLCDESLAETMQAALDANDSKTELLVGAEALEQIAAEPRWMLSWPLLLERRVWPLAWRP